MPYPSGHSDPVVAAVIFLLDDWLNALEDGSARYRLPDLAYVRSGGKAPWTEDQLNTLVHDIDAEVSQEVTRFPGTSVGATAGPDFSRLAPPQRLALAQQLEQVLGDRQMLGDWTEV